MRDTEQQGIEYKQLSDKSFHSGSPWNEEQFVSFIEEQGHGAIEVREQGVLQGFLLYSFVLDESELILIGIAPDQKRQGIGTQLIDKMKEQLLERKVERVLLEVRTSNRGAQFFYENRGFHLIGTRKNYYHSPVEDGLIMELYIGSDEHA